MSNLNGDGKGREIERELLTAYALGQLEGEELEQGARAAGGEAVQQDINEIRKVAEAVAASRSTEALPVESAKLREKIEARLLETARKVVPLKFVDAGESRMMWWRRAVAVMCLGGGVAGLLFAISFATVANRVRHASWSVARLNDALTPATDAEGVAASTPQPTKKKENALRYQSPTDEAAEAPAEPRQRMMTRSPEPPTADFESTEKRSTAPEANLAQVPKGASDVELRTEVRSRGGGLPATPPVASDPLATHAGDAPGSTPYVPPKDFAIAPRGRGTPRPGTAPGGYGSADGGLSGGYGGNPDVGYLPAPEGFDRRAARAAPPANVPGVYPEAKFASYS
jgi:hypothetical protein